ncbi:hypothetical protein QJ854_gp692 [Moumouvirus goulette]|uniref:Uncharacterized protein n=1 Tax=Moumouvirus goulette TaxID=1247379 RepID=M1NM43_9VIRU|nr:hypothetical protein QJ854_gp692 [Moumouvirus goulette]AGF85090.1 hypothetical protein glt_00281 [Moumouvirus goulette]
MLMTNNNLSMILSDFYEKVNPTSNYTRFTMLLDTIKSQSYLNSSVESVEDPRTIFKDFFGRIKTFSNGPLGYSIILSLCLLFYFYFANNFVYYIIGLFIPCYLTYRSISDENFNIVDIHDMAIYFIIFSNIEFITRVVELMISLIFLKIAVVIFFNIILIYNKDLLNFIYEKIIMFDDFMLIFISFVLIKLYNEIVKIFDNVQAVLLTDSKKQM